MEPIQIKGMIWGIFVLIWVLVIAATVIIIKKFIK